MKSLIVVFSLFLSILLVTGCQPETLEIPDAEQYSHIFMQSANENPISKTFAMDDHWEVIPVGAGYGGALQLPRDVEISFQVKPELVAAYNLSNATNYAVVPEGSYRITQGTAVIKAGQNGSNDVNLEVNPLKLGGTRSFLLPVSITTVSNGIKVQESLRTTYYLVNGVYSSNPYTPYAQDTWSILEVSSDDYDTGGGRANFAIDGDVNTFWHSQYRYINGTRPSHPHFISVNMGKEQELHGLEIDGRVNQVGGNGNAKDIVVEVSLNGTDWTSMGSYTLDNQLATNTVYFPEAAVARFFKITVVASHGNVYRTHTAEIRAF